MDPFVSLDLNPMPAADARLAAISSAAFYGKGVFTTVAIKAGRPFLWDKHWARLRENAARLNIGLQDLGEEDLTDALYRILQSNSRTEGRARITLFDNAAGGPWHSGEPASTSILITSADRPVRGELRVLISPHFLNSTSPLAGVKSCNYLEPVIAMDEAKKLGFDEAIRLNERGEIASGCMANLFWEKDGKLFTPSLTTGCLAGTTREYILENLECEEVDRTIDAIEAADEVFLTSSGLGVAQAAEIGRRKLQKRHHPILDLIPG